MTRTGLGHLFSIAHKIELGFSARQIAHVTNVSARNLNFHFFTTVLFPVLTSIESMASMRRYFSISNSLTIAFSYFLSLSVVL